MKLAPRQLVLVAAAFTVLFIVGAGAASAQVPAGSSSTSGVFCNLMNYLYPAATRAIIAVVAGMAALLSMWQENSNVMTWIKRHQMLFIFAIALIAGPTVVVQILGASTTCSFQ